jgi:hypothetical protein
MLLTHVLAFAAGAALVWLLRRAAPPAPPAAAAPVHDDPMRAPDPELDAEIIEYIGENQVLHINDICLALEHPKGARFVRAHVHMLLEEGKIRYRNMVYSI